MREKELESVQKENISNNEIEEQNKDIGDKDN